MPLCFKQEKKTAKMLCLRPHEQELCGSFLGTGFWFVFFFSTVPARQADLKTSAK